MPEDNNWEEKIALSFDDMFGEKPSTDDLIDDIEVEIPEETEAEEGEVIENDFEDTDPATDGNMILAQCKMVMLKGFADAFPGKKMFYRGKPSKTYCEFYMKNCTKDQLIVMDCSQLSTRTKLDYNKAIEDLPRTDKKNKTEEPDGLSEEEFDTLEQETSEDGLLAKATEQLEEMRNSLVQKTAFAQSLIEQLDWLYGFMGRDGLFDMIGDPDDDDIINLKGIKEVIS